MKVIIAEKRSLAKIIASSLNAKLYPVEKVYNDDTIVCHAHGHLLELIDMNDYFGEKIPWGEKLPFFPEQFRFRIKKDDGDKRLYKDIANLINLKSCDEIICAGDADREGEVIVRLILKYGLKSPKKITRLWLPSQTESVIREQMKARKNDSEYDNLYNEGIARTYMDWLIGINLTRAISYKANTLLRVGRVLCPIVLAIYQREEEIKNFSPTYYYSLESNVNGIKLVSKNKFELSQEYMAEEYCRDYNSKKAIVLSVEKKTVEKVSPKLFSLSKLQGTCGKLLKLSPQQTLSTVQSLYEKGLVTYPRTNTEFLAETEKEKVKILLGIHGKGNTIFKDTKRIFDDSKIESHSALTPTEKELTSAIKLSPIEVEVYNLILKRFLSLFWKEPCLLDKTVAKIQVGKNQIELIEVKGTAIKEKGWMALEKHEKVDTEIPNFVQAQLIDVDFEPIKKQTQPPKSYTVESLGNYLVNPFRKESDTEDEEYKQLFLGCEIGTEATRASIIDKAIQNEYISLKNNVYKIEEKGVFLAKTLDKLKIDMGPYQTVELQKILKKVYRDEVDVQHSLIYTKDMLSQYIQNVFGAENVEFKEKSSLAVIGKCPWCGLPVYEFKSKYGTYYSHTKEDKKNCSFTLSDTITIFGQHVSLTKGKINQLLCHKKPTISLQSKAGKPYSVKVDIKSTPYTNANGKKFPDYEIEYINKNK